ncbi:MAG: outer membrane lipoprotein chaperone LolA [Gammaproteobacteria bacterium]|jgi:outer membrane lipoprotein carrier protein
MQKVVPVLLALLSFAPSSSGEGDEGAQALRHFLEDVVSLRSGFVQRIYASDSEEPQVSEGLLMIKRPGRFRWEYTSPTEQLVVCDGEKLWMYDPDLEQVTVREIDQSLRGTPAMLLSGQATLDETFRVLDSYREEGLVWVALEPLADSPEFENLRIGMADGVLKRMELTDSLGQMTRIDLSNVATEADLEDGLFVFVPPDGADVIGQGGGF